VTKHTNKEGLVARWSLRTIAPLAAVGCAGLVATRAIVQRRARGRRWLLPDPPDRHLADEMMEALATDEGMPEVDGG
jgi:hypothetical protein